MSITHQLVRDGETLTKRYVSWDRAEHRREWTVLSRIQEHTTDLAPRPLAADLEAEPPWITMSLLPGEPIHGRYPAGQLDALESALRELWSVPPAGLDRPRITGIRDLLATRRRPPAGAAAAAYDAAIRWWRGPEPGQLAGRAGAEVLGHGDPNLANYLWDGRRLRVVDFEDAARSDVAFELATLVEHLSARDVIDPGFCRRFDVDEGRLRSARRLWAISGCRCCCRAVRRRAGTRPGPWMPRPSGCWHCSEPRPRLVCSGLARSARTCVRVSPWKPRLPRRDANTSRALQGET